MFPEYPAHRHIPLSKAKSTASLYSVFAPVSRNTPSPNGASSNASSDDESQNSTISSRRPLPEPPRNTLTVPPGRLSPRPLPKPPVDGGLHPTSSQTSFQFPNSPSSSSSSPYPNSTPASSHASSLIDISDRTLHLEIPTFEPLQVHIQSPSSPISPVVFAFPPMSPELFKKSESALAERMMELGFVEDVRSRTSRSPSPLQSSSRRDEIDTSLETSDPDHDVVLLVELQEEQEQSARKDSCAHHTERVMKAKDKVHGPCDTSDTALACVPQTKAKRFSRKWVREKKGKRWVEKDYQEVLQALRRLR